MKLASILIASAIICAIFLHVGRSAPNHVLDTNDELSGKDMSKFEQAVLGGGCFWCTEAIFQRIKGVSKVEPGYAGGKLADPTYEDVSRGSSGHAEVVEVTFDPAVVSYADLLEIFFHLHDPTTLNRQGSDVGTQYRSAIFYMSDEQKKTAQEVMKKIEAEKLWNSPLVTTLEKFDKFYVAEDYHKNYFNTHGSQPYCSIVIGPKIAKLEKTFAAKLKPKS